MWLMASLLGLWVLINQRQSNTRLEILERKIRDLEIAQRFGQAGKEQAPVSTVSPTTEKESVSWEKFASEPTPAKPQPPAAEAPPIHVNVPQLTAKETRVTMPGRITMPHEPVYRTVQFSSEPSEPSRLAGLLIRSLTGGRLFVTLGLLLLFMGTAMLFKYMAHFIIVPIEVRFLGVALGAIALIAFGRKQVGTRRDYGLYLQGGGLGLLFMTVFSAFKFYSLIEPSTALILLIAIGGATFFLSIANNAIALSVLAVTGGFLAPVLTSTGHGSHIGLFGYYLVINLVIFAIAWHKSWRVLNAVGFFFTFVIALMWGGKYYVPEFYPSVQAFLVIFFMLYTGIGVLYAMHKTLDLKYPVDAAPVFGVPLIGFGLQLLLVRHFPDGDLFSSIALAAFYGVLSQLLKSNPGQGLQMLARVFMALSLLFSTLAIPFAFSHNTTATLWAMEGVALLWMQGQTKERFYGYAGILVLGLSNIFMLKVLHLQGVGDPFFNTFFLSAMLMAVTHFAASFLMNRHSFIPDDDGLSATVFSIAGMCWWFGAGFAEIADWPLLQGAFLTPSLGFFVLSAAGAEWVARKTGIPLLEYLVALILPAVIGVTLIQFTGGASYHPLQGYGKFALPLAFVVHYAWLRRLKDLAFSFFHVAAFITLVALCGFELGYWLHHLQPDGVQLRSGWLLAAAGGIALLALPEKSQFWPLSVLNQDYRASTAIPLVVWAVLLCFYTFVQYEFPYSGYVPLLNAVDLAELATLLSLSALYQSLATDRETRPVVAALLAACGFGFFTCFMLRNIGAPLMLPYFSDAMFNSTIIQTALTILWTLIAMAAMIVSSRKEIREGWFAGAVLLGVVIAKLFLIDLDGVGTLSRIISFMGVGMLSLMLGYFSPVPAKRVAA